MTLILLLNGGMKVVFSMAKGNNERMWRRALGLTAFLIIIGFGAVVLSLFRWQIVHGEELSTAALDQSLRSTSLPAVRGTIYDATGTKVLAQSASVWTVVLEPNYLRDDDPEEEEELRRTISAGLAEILELDAEDIYEKSGQNSWFTYLKRKVETEIRDEILAFLEEEKISNGVRFLQDYKRYYPYGTVAANVLGFTGNDGNGLDGLESYYDDELEGTPGRLIASKNGWGTDMPFEYEQFVGAEDGNDLVLTIDETVQSILEKYLEEGIEKYAIKNGAIAIMMNVNTGGIIGLATNPNYDPNDPFTILDEKLLAEIEDLPESEQDAAYTNAQYKQWRNKAVSDTYYPGSVYKMCVGSMGLEEGIITENTGFVCTGNIAVEGVTDGISCWYHSGHGAETFRQGLCNSCNPCFIQIGNMLGAQTFCKYREAFGMTEQTGIDLPGESYSLYHSLADMGPSELATEAFGQNFSITPVQMITACSAIANGGYLVKPHVVDRVIDSEGNIVSTADTGYRRQVISEETSAIITDILLENATSGTANGGYVAGYRICGKTGTSEKIAQHKEDPTQPMEYIASYCGFAPADDPQYALLVYFDEPDGSENGGLTGGNAIAGPIFAKMMAEILPYLGVEAQYSDEEYANLDMVTPNTVGMTLAEAYQHLDAMELGYTVIGDESDESIIVTEQMPQSGTPVPKGGQVVLYTKGYNESNIWVEVPDFTGLDLVNAAYTATINGLQVSVAGSATDSSTVNMQDIEAGESVKQGAVITLTFVDDINTETYVSIE